MYRQVSESGVTEIFLRLQLSAKREANLLKRNMLIRNEVRRGDSKHEIMYVNDITSLLPTVSQKLITHDGSN